MNFNISAKVGGSSLSHVKTRYFIYPYILKYLGFISLLVLTAIGCGVQSFCRKNNSDDELYSNGGAGSFLRGDRYKKHTHSHLSSTLTTSSFHSV